MRDSLDFLGARHFGRQSPVLGSDQRSVDCPVALARAMIRAWDQWMLRNWLVPVACVPGAVWAISWGVRAFMG